MKSILVLTLTLLTLGAHAQRSSTTALMVCLGREEKAFHQRKLVGPNYDLNQRLIGELVLINKIDAPKRVIQKMCRSNRSPSLELLEEMLLNPKGWYTFPADYRGVEANISQELVKELNLGTPEILLNYLSQLQALSPDAHCLNDKVPGIKTLNEEVKFLQEEVDLAKLAGRKSRLRKIFAGIKNADRIFEQCRKEIAQASSKSRNKESSTGKSSTQ